MKKQAFTLVELIVVVTILAILATIGFVSYSGYLTGVRDTNRIASLTSISDGLELYRTKNDLPNPDDGINIQIEGTTIANQGYAGANVLQTIEYSKAGKDPKDDSYYSYYLTDDKKHYQLMAFLEETENLESYSLVGKTNAAVNYSNRHPKVYGKKLGILTDSNNTPVQETITSSLNFTGGTTTDYIARFTDSQNITASGSNLSSIAGNANCKRIKELKGSSKDGMYPINPTGTGTINVYCDMTTNGGGWTMVYNQEWSDNEKIVGNLDTTTGIAGISSEHGINPVPIYAGNKREILIQQDNRWIVIGDTNLDIFNEIFNETGEHQRDLEISLSSNGVRGLYMDQDAHGTVDGVYQWNVVGSINSNNATCFEYSKSGSDSNHEWIVYPDCDGTSSVGSGVSFPRRAMVFLR